MEKLNAEQKFEPGDRVYVKVVSPNMSHFTTNFNGIVDGSYNDLYQNMSYNLRDLTIFSVYVLSVEGKIINSVAWYNESDLTLLSKPDTASYEAIRNWKRSWLR